MNETIIAGFDAKKDKNLAFILEKGDMDDALLVIHVAGYIDSKNSSYFQDRVTTAIDTGYSKLVLELAGLSYVSSTGIGAFTTILAHARKSDGNIILVSIQPKVAEVFHLLGFAQSFTIVDSVAQATAIFSGLHDKGAHGLFPAILICPSCAKKQKIVKPGRFRCIECKKILTIDESGAVHSD